MKKLFLLFTAVLFLNFAQGQVRTPTIYVTGTVLSDEKMLVSVIGTKTIEGNVVTAEINGKKTEARTDKKGHAQLDFSKISSGLVGPTVAVIKSFDKKGNLISTANTTIQPGNLRVPAPPVIEQLPANMSSGETVTIPGQNLGADAQLVCGEQIQETLSASDKEMTVFTNAKPGEQPLYVITPNGVSESQNVNIYTLDFVLSKNSISPKENVQAQVSYESIPEGTKLIFTNKSPQTIKMTIPGAQNAANECIYTVSQNSGNILVNITGIIRGNFQIALDFVFKDDTVINKKETAIKELKLGLTKLNEHDQKVIFDFLPAEIKCALWKDHLSESVKMPLLQSQKELIQELDSHLTPDIYGTTTASAAFMSYAFGWYTRAKSAFTGSDTAKLENIVMQLGSSQSDNSLLQQAKIPDCDCVRNGAIGNCPIYFSCKWKKCRVNRCGIFWFWKCDAMCI